MLAMTPIDQVVANAGGAVRRQHLLELGFTARNIRSAVNLGILVAVTRSWVAAPDARPDILTALQLGGVVAGTAALETYGVWVTHPGAHVIALRPRSHRPRTGPDIECFEASFTLDRRAPWRVSLMDALVQMCRHATKRDAIASIDSALRKGLLVVDDLQELASRLPKAKRAWLRQVNGQADSGLESILRIACEDAGWQVEIQVPLQGGRVDLVLNGWLYIEIDGSEFHDFALQAKKDRYRNNQIAASGMRWHRFSYADIVHNLERSMATLRIILAQRPVPIS